MKIAVDPRVVRATEAEFLSWPDSMQKIELIDGDVVRSPAPTLDHQEILRRLLLDLGSWARGQAVLIGQSSCDVRFGPSASFNRMRS